MQREAPLPADGTEMQDAQQPQTAVDAQVKGATHAQAHSEVATREVFGRLDTDVDGKISATKASAATSPDFAAMDREGDGLVNNAEYRAKAQTANPERDQEPKPDPEPENVDHRLDTETERAGCRERGDPTGE